MGEGESAGKEGSWIKEGHSDGVADKSAKNPVMGNGLSR